MDPLDITYDRQREQEEISSKWTSLESASIGEKWTVLPAPWCRKWRDYVNFDLQTGESAYDEKTFQPCFNHPGDIDTDLILDLEESHVKKLPVLSSELGKACFVFVNQDIGDLFFNVFYKSSDKDLRIERYVMSPNYLDLYPPILRFIDIGYASGRPDRSSMHYRMVTTKFTSCYDLAIDLLRDEYPLMTNAELATATHRIRFWVEKTTDETVCREIRLDSTLDFYYVKSHQMKQPLDSIHEFVNLYDDCVVLIDRQKANGDFRLPLPLYESAEMEGMEYLDDLDNLDKLNNLDQKNGQSEANMYGEDEVKSRVSGLYDALDYGHGEMKREQHGMNDVNVTDDFDRLNRTTGMNGKDDPHGSSMRLYEDGAYGSISPVIITEPPNDNRLFRVGECLDCQDIIDDKWYTAYICSIDYTKKIMTLHFRGFLPAFDLTLPFDSPRIAEAGMYTKIAPENNYYRQKGAYGYDNNNGNNTNGAANGDVMKNEYLEAFSPSISVKNLDGEYPFEKEQEYSHQSLYRRRPPSFRHDPFNRHPALSPYFSPPRSQDIYPMYNRDDPREHDGDADDEASFYNRPYSARSTDYWKRWQQSSSATAMGADPYTYNYSQDYYTKYYKSNFSSTTYSTPHVGTTTFHLKSDVLGPPDVQGVVGLVNTGNTCYLNSVLQCLFHCPDLMSYFLERKNNATTNSSDKQIEENALGSNPVGRDAIAIEKEANGRDAIEKDSISHVSTDPHASTTEDMKMEKEIKEAKFSPIRTPTHMSTHVSTCALAAESFIATTIPALGVLSGSIDIPATPVPIVDSPPAQTILASNLQTALAQYVFHDHLNLDNPLGWKGRIGTAFAQIVHTYWAHKHKIIYPASFKKEIGACYTQFEGSSQQDSAEFLQMLLDAIHEDLNLIKKKPATIPVEAKGDMTDESVASKNWDLYLLRNQSIAVNLFSGQFKSTLICTTCQHRSLVFEPFMSVTLPIPQGMMKQPEPGLRYVNVYVSQAGQSRKIARKQFSMAFGLDDTLDRIREKIATIALPGDLGAPNQLVLMVYHTRLGVQAFYHPHFSPSSVVAATFPCLKTDRDAYLHAFYLPLEDLTSMHRVPIPVIGQFTLKRHHNKAVVTTYPLCGFPDVMMVDTCRLDVPPKSEPVNPVNPVNSVNSPPTVDLPSTLNPMPTIGSSIDQSSNKKESTENQGWENPPKWYYVSDLLLKAQTFAQESQAIAADINIKTKILFTAVRALENQKCAFESCFFDKTSTCDGCDMLNKPNHRLLWNDKLGISMIAVAIVYETIQHFRAYPSLVKDASVADLESLYTPAKVTLYDCLTEFHKPEALTEQNAVKCGGNCNSIQPASKHISIWKSSKYLILHLKRFCMLSGVPKKIKTVVTFPLVDADFSKYIDTLDSTLRYDCIAVSVHAGEVGGGHYTAYCKNHTTQDWYEFDDRSTCKIEDPETTISAHQGAYVLIYQLKELSSR